MVLALGFQAQYPLLKQYTLNHTKAPFSLRFRVYGLGLTLNPIPESGVREVCALHVLEADGLQSSEAHLPRNAAEGASV